MDLSQIKEKTKTKDNDKVSRELQGWLQKEIKKVSSKLKLDYNN